MKGVSTVGTGRNQSRRATERVDAHARHGSRQIFSPLGGHAKQDFGGHVTTICDQYDSFSNLFVLTKTHSAINFKIDIIPLCVSVGKIFFFSEQSELVTVYDVDKDRWFFKPLKVIKGIEHDIVLKTNQALSFSVALLIL